MSQRTPWQGEREPDRRPPRRDPGQSQGQASGSYDPRSGHSSHAQRPPDDAEPRARRGTQVIFSRYHGHTHQKVLDSPFYFQCPPQESWQMTSAATHAEYDTIRAGQFSRAGSRQLTTIEFSTLMLWTDDGSDGDYWPAFASAMVPDVNPIKARDQLTKILRTMTPFWCQIGMPRYWNRWDWEGPVTLRSIQSEERAAEIDTRYFNIQLSEYREPRVGRNRRSGHPMHPHIPATIELVWPAVIRTVKHHKTVPISKPFTLSKLAKFFYGASSEWRRIARKNGLTDVRAHEDLMTLAKHRRGYLKLRIPPGAHSGGRGSEHGGHDPETGGVSPDFR